MDTLFERNDGTFGIVGVDHGYGKCVIVAENKRFLIGHIPGTTFANGTSRSYGEPHLAVYEKHGDWWEAEEGERGWKKRHIQVTDLMGLISLDIGRGWLKRAKEKKGVKT